MIKIQQYKGRHIKDGKAINGYAAIGADKGKAFILAPVSTDTFSIYEVDKESLEEYDLR